MTDLNKVKILPPSESPLGNQIAITNIDTSGFGQLIAVVPGSSEEWAEMTIEACNVNGASTTYSLVLQLGSGDARDAIIKSLSFVGGVSTMIDGRIMRGGMKIGARCLNANGTGAGVASQINVYVRPAIVYEQ